MDFSKLFSLSTCWNVDRHQSGRAMIGELMQTGFRRFELNYHVTREMADEILPMAERGEIGISSVHNVFPDVLDNTYGPDSLLLGFPDREKRERAINLTLGSVEQAVRFGAEAVVIHPGEASMPTEFSRLMDRLCHAGRRDTRDYTDLLAVFKRMRAETAPTHTSLIRDSLETVCNRMVQKGWNVKLGIETRSMAHQIPDFEEARQILDGLPGMPVYLWNDIGHSSVLEAIGMVDAHASSLKLLDRTLGLHIHDIQGTADHYCPYQFTDKTDRWLDVIRAAPIKVFEVSRSCTAEDIRRSAEAVAGKM